MKEFVLTKPQLKFLANSFSNLAAAWFAVILISPRFSNFENPNDLVNLIYSFLSAILYSAFAIKLEEELENAK